MRRNSGITLLEVLIAVTLLSVLSAGMMMAMRIGISALSRTDARLMDNRRVAGAQRVLEQELQAMIPVVAPCANGGAPVPIFSGLPNGITMVTGFSLQAAWRGRPQVIQMFVISGEDGGSRLVVNETPYTGPVNAGKLCNSGGGNNAVFPPPTAGPTTYVLADHLRAVSFQYLHVGEKPEDPGIWTPGWGDAGWPVGIRILMEPLSPSPARLQPISVTVPIYVYRDPGAHYAAE